MLLKQRYIPTKNFLTHISHLLELLFLEFGQRGENFFIYKK